jgi:uncharacterized protein YwgA
MSAFAPLINNLIKHLKPESAIIPYPPNIVYVAVNVRDHKIKVDKLVFLHLRVKIIDAVIHP